MDVQGQSHRCADLAHPTVKATGVQTRTPATLEPDLEDNAPTPTHEPGAASLPWSGTLWSGSWEPGQGCPPPLTCNRLVIYLFDVLVIGFDYEQWPESLSNSFLSSSFCEYRESKAK